MLATEAGRIAWRAQLDVYGVPREEQGVAAAEERTANPWRFPGQYEDAETGLYYNRFRYYDPGLGRYLSEDPIGLAGGIALFAYVHDPAAWLDVVGLKACRGPETRKRGVFVEATRTKSGELLVTSGPLSAEQARSRLRGMMQAGDSERGIYTVSKQDARDLAAATGRNSPTIHSAHIDRATGSKAGRYPHYHPAGAHGGHVWYGSPHS